MQRISTLVAIAFCIALTGTLLLTGWGNFASTVTTEEEKISMGNGVVPLVAEPSFVQEMHFPNLSRYDIRPMAEHKSKFLIRTSDGVAVMDTSSGTYKHYVLSTRVKNLEMGDFTMVGDRVVFSTGFGIGVYNITTDTVATYSTSDGLVDYSNIQLHPDPYDPEVVWVGTFRGLSKFDLRTRTFENHTSQMGLSGVEWEPKVFFIDKESIWVSVGANVNTAGGVARFNKAEGRWTAWGPETFTIDGEVNSRIDAVYMTEGSEKYIIIEDDNVEFIFDRSTEEWNILRRNRQQDPIRLGLNIIGDWLYYKQGGVLMAYNFTSGESTTNDYTTAYKKLTGSDINYYALDIRFDDRYNRFLVIPSMNEIASSPHILELRMSDGMLVEQTMYVATQFFEQYQYTNVTILDMKDTALLLKTPKELVVYDMVNKKPLQTWSMEALLTGGWDLKAKLYGEKVAVHVANYCEGMCHDDFGYTATTTFFDRVSGESVLSVPFSASTSEWVVLWDEENPGAQLQTYSRTSALAFRLNVTKKAYKKTVSYDDDSSYVYIDVEQFVPVENSQTGLQYIERRVGDEREVLVVTQRNSEGAEERHDMKLPTIVNAFGTRPGYEIADVAYVAPTAWFVTDRGVVSFNEVKKTWRLYTTEDGLRTNANDSLRIGGRFIFTNGYGVGIYQFTEKE